MNKCELIGEGVSSGIAGEPAHLEMRCRDAYGNDAEKTELMGFGLVLIAMPSNDKSKGEKSKAVAADGEDGKEKSKPSKMTAAERANLVKTSPSIAFDGRWEGTSYSLEYIPKDAGDFELHFWCDPDGSGSRVFLPGCPSQLHVSAGRASSIGSYIRDSANLTNVAAGERLVLRVQTRDEYNNNAALQEPDQDLSAQLETPNGPVALILKPHNESVVRQSLKKEAPNPQEGGMAKREAQKAHAAAAAAVGAYEVVTQGELTLKGEHTAMISLHGVPITGSPLQFAVRPAAPVAAKSYLVPPAQPTAHVPCEVLLQLVDKYGNNVERGEVRVDAKAFGPKASEVQVVDCENGTYTLSFTASVPGDYKTQVRLENVDMSPLTIHFQQRTSEAEATAPATAPAAAPLDAQGAPSSADPLLPPAGDDSSGLATLATPPAADMEEKKRRSSVGGAAAPMAPSAAPPLPPQPPPPAQAAPAGAKRPSKTPPPPKPPPSPMPAGAPLPAAGPANLIYEARLTELDAAAGEPTDAASSPGKTAKSAAKTKSPAKTPKPNQSAAAAAAAAPPTLVDGAAAKVEPAASAPPPAAAPPGGSKGGKGNKKATTPGSKRGPNSKRGSSKGSSKKKGKK